MNKYYLAWGACAAVAYLKYKDYLIRYPGIAFEDAVFSFFVGAGFFTIIFFLWDWGKKRLSRSQMKVNENARPIREYQEQSQRMIEWEQACRDGETEARRRAAEQARRNK